MVNLADSPEHAQYVRQMRQLMEDWRDQLGDPFPLAVDNPEPKVPQYDNSRRVKDRWQPEWIRRKYFADSATR